MKKRLTVVRITRDEWLSRFIAELVAERYSIQAIAEYLWMRGYEGVTLAKVAYHAKAHDSDADRAGRRVDRTEPSGRATRSRQHAAQGPQRSVLRGDL